MCRTLRVLRKLASKRSCKVFKKYIELNRKLLIELPSK
jgi:hypothetical protein